MLDVMGCAVHVEQRGRGTPLLMLHGNPDSSALWDGMIDHLADGHRCIAPDLPGYGRSSAPADFDYSLAGQAAFVDALVTALGIHEPVHLVGHDFGGIFGAAWMSAQPHKVRSFTVSNAAFSSAFRWHVWARIWRTPGLGELSMATMNRPVFGLELRRGSRALPKAHIDATYGRITPAVKATVLKLYRTVRPASFAGWEQRYLAAAERVPVLVLWGEDDPYIPAEFAERFAPRRLVRVAGAGHWLPVVEPARCAAELRRFIAEHDADRSAG